MTKKAVTVDASTVMVIQYETNNIVCDECGKYIDPRGREVEVLVPEFHFDRAALQRGFDETFGSGRAEPLAALPGGDLQSFGEFSERVVALAANDWSAIASPEPCSVRLISLFPFGDRLLPILQIGERRESLAGAPISRDELVKRADIGLATDSLETADVLCGFAVDAANELLRNPEALVEFTG
jgi:hypothetical protein